MEVALTECVPVTDASSVGEARRAALTLGHRLGFDETRTGELALLATEASRNVLIHGGGGQVVVSGITSQGNPLARILALDSGPGIPDISRAMNDGYSTSGTMGGGLGAMKRIASGFEIYSGPGGTILLLELGETQPGSEVQIAGVAVPYPGERVCGDGWIAHSDPGRTMIMVADGLGHGWGAAEAARESIATFNNGLHLGPAAMLEAVHAALRKTRGAVAAVVEIRPRDRELKYAGVGNISAAILGPDSSRSLMSHSGTLGATASRIQELRFDWPPGAILVVHSDGLQTRWDLASYAGLAAKHPAIIGGALLRDFRRQRDDVSIVVVKAA